MTKKGREFNEIYDLTAMRVIVDSVKDCYGAIGIIHSIWKPLPGRFKDFVATPKLNLYQALHTTVIGPEGRPLEIQIRTPDMHELAEYGIAAHVIYKEGSGRSKSDPSRDKMTWLRQLLEAESDQDPAEFLEALKVDLFEDEVFVFTPRGEVKNLSAGSTPLDFAYAVHTDVGHRCVGAKVNGKIVPLHYQLQERRHRRDPHREAGARAVARLARAGAHEPRPQQDPRLPHARAPRGRRAPRPRGAPGGAAKARPADAEDRRLAAAGRRHPRDGLPQGRRLLHRPRPGQDLVEDGHQQGLPAAEAGRGRRRATRPRRAWPASSRAATSASAAPRTHRATGSRSRASTT